MPGAKEGMGYGVPHPMEGLLQVHAEGAEEDVNVAIPLPAPFSFGNEVDEPRVPDVKDGERTESEDAEGCESEDAEGYESLESEGNYSESIGSVDTPKEADGSTAVGAKRRTELRSDVSRNRRMRKSFTEYVMAESKAYVQGKK